MKGLRAYSYGKCGGKEEYIYIYRERERENFVAGSEDRNSLQVLGLEVRVSLMRIFNKCCGMGWT